MATPDLKIRRTGGQSLTANQISHVRVNSRVSHVLGSGNGARAILVRAGEVGAKAKEIGAKAGGSAGMASVKVGAETLAGQAVAADNDDSLAESQGHGTMRTVASTGRRGVSAAGTVGGKLGAKAGGSAGMASVKVGAETLAGQAVAADNDDSLAESQGHGTMRTVASTGRRGVSAAGTVGGKLGAKAGTKAESATLKRLGQPSKAQVSSLTSRVVGARSKRQAQKVAYRQLATGKTAPTRMARRMVNRIARGVSSMVGKIVTVLMAKVSVVLLAIFVVCTLVILVLSIISSFLPAWITGDEADHPAAEAGAGIVGVVADGLGNDYPYADRTYNTLNSATGYYFGNCTDFVIWRVNRDAGVTSAPWKYTNANTTPGGGNGYQWGAASALPGWTIVDKPSPGDIVSFQPGSQNGRWNAVYGHVAYVGQVSDDGSMILENYGTGEYFQTTYTAEQMSQLVSSGQAVIKHNPNSKVKIKTSDGVSTVDALGTLGGNNIAGGPLSATSAQATAKSLLKDYGWGDDQYQCLVNLWNGESGWNYEAENPSSGAYGIPQALPGSKMASAGADWKTNAATQIKWGLDYIKSRPDYGSPCAAWNKWQSRSPHWY